MTDSILDSVKKVIGGYNAGTEFDNDIIMHINTALATLQQIGVGLTNNFQITGSSETWSDFTNDIANIQYIKTYVYIKVRLVFDIQSLTSYMIDSFTKTTNEIEWRLMVQTDPEPTTEETEG